MARPIDSAQSDICRRLVDLDGDCGGGGLITGCCGDDDDDDDVEVCSETESIHDGRTDGRMDAGAEAGSDRLSCDVRRHCQRRLIHVSIYIPERRVDNAVTGTLAAGHQHAPPQKSNNANICSPARVTVKYEEPSGVLRGGDEILWHAHFFSVLKKF